MIMDEYDGQMIFGDLGGLKLPDICLTGEEKPRKNLTQETCPNWGSNPGLLHDRHACYHLSHSGGHIWSVLSLIKVINTGYRLGKLKWHLKLIINKWGHGGAHAPVPSWTGCPWMQIPKGFHGLALFFTLFLQDKVKWTMGWGISLTE